MELFASQLLNGLALGSLYGLFGIGFGLVFATLGILNAAQGCYASWAAIAGLIAAERAGLPFPLIMLAGMGGAAAVAVIVDQMGFQPLRARGADMLGALITSIAFWMILDSLAGFATGQQSLSFPPQSYPGQMLLTQPVPLPAMQLIAILALVVVAVGTHLLMTRSAVGSAIRAVGWNPVSAALSGVNSRYVIVLTAALSGAISGTAGILGGVLTANVSFTLGQGLMLKGFAAVVVGGYSDVRGTAIAGVVLGILEVFVGQYFSASYRDAFTYSLLLIFLLVKPQGLFGKGSFVRA
ncbi:branched-chain amino acid ABC transporter permease [Variovorax sp. PBL-E5]|uniref:branched-chain amino acid ABC transporter permease n=1 Tax=Variovorax sp. PBL-E5 TaxID=434014 RepID=UPI0013180A12|nr:branched-chain amino acid ABC transporter permease [Variovorax sp. PBL-E5]VTU46029.1 LIV-I protein H [Variovorax sp. PBL-E5]